MNRSMVSLALLLGGGCIVVEEKDTTDTDTLVTDGDADTDADSDADADADSDTDSDTDTVPPDPDDDLDGFTVGDGDCNDTDENINPDALEICDTIDNNCDLGIDDAAPVTLDGVNYATIDEAITAALAPATGVTPGTLEVCAGDHTMTSVQLAGSLALHAVSGRDETTLSEATGAVLLRVRDGGSLSIDGFTVSNSTAQALQIEDEASLTVSNSRISFNGQGLFIDGGPSTIVIVSTDIEDNVNANGDGGGIAATGLFDLSITDSNVQRNSAQQGGGLYAEKVFAPPSTLTLTNTHFDLNIAEEGAGIILKNVVAIGDGVSSVVGGIASGAGGGIGMFRSEASGLVVSGNSAPNGGGIAVLFDNDFETAELLNSLTGMVVDSNTAIENGGGLFIEAREQATLDATCAVTLNTAAIGGGAFVEGQDSSLVSNGADFGTDGLNDNVPDDVSTTAVSPYFFEPGDTFSCTGDAGCVEP